MKLEKLIIAPMRDYSAVGPSNPYCAKLSVSYNENTMQVTLSPEVCTRIMRLAGDEISKSAQIQIADFVQTAIAASTAPAIEAKIEA
jgi:hypothetical protein